jgi:hypothetical protein
VVAGSASPHVGPLVAVLGALLLVLAGVVLAVGEPRLPRLGGRYATRGVAREAATDSDRADPDRAAWDALDAGRDPTADRAPSARSSIEPSTEPSTQPAARPHTDPPARPGRTDGGEPGRAV